MKCLPPWFRQEIPANLESIRNRLREFKNHSINTVCVSAHCPNLNSCFENNGVTFMILGTACSRKCGFCAVQSGRIAPLSLAESILLAQTAKKLNLKYVVVTSVSRDDLPYAGATQFARTVYLIRAQDPMVKIELLIPDFNASRDSLSLVVRSSPDIIAHNLETVRRLYPAVRPQADYERSLDVLAKTKKIGFAGWTKSGIMLGLGESEDELLRAMRDLKDAGCDILTLGQYLSPSSRHFAVREFIDPGKFASYRKEAQAMGFKAVHSGPLVRSSYKAQAQFEELMKTKDDRRRTIDDRRRTKDELKDIN